MAANREKTIEWMLPNMLGNISEGTSYTDSADTTIYIPETTSRAFKSVVLEVYCHDNHATVSANLTTWAVRGSCDSGSNWTSLTGAGWGQNGEHMPIFTRIDVTAEFTGRFGSGTSGTFRYGLYNDYSATGPTFTNVSAKLIITYEYDDTGLTTTVKTVRIPIESFSGRLSNTAQEIRQGTITNQIPDLDDLLPESSKTYRQIFCELYTNFYPSATTDTTLYLKIDSGSETTYGTVEAGYQSPIGMRVLYDISSIDTANAHALNARHNVSSQSYFANLGGWVTVTYEYTISGTTSVINSLILAIGQDRDVATSDTYRFEESIIFAPPESNVTLKQSGVVVRGQINGTADLDIKVGSQTATTYSTLYSGAGHSGDICLVHRIDSGGYRGAGMTLSSGNNTIRVQLNPSNLYAWGLSAYVILNYTSDLDEDGEGVHTHTVAYFQFAPGNTAANQTGTASRDVVINATNYYLHNVMWDLHMPLIAGYFVFLMTMLKKASAGIGYGRLSLMDLCIYAPTGRFYEKCVSNITRHYKKHPNDPDTSFPEKQSIVATSRGYKSYLFLSTYNPQCMIWLTYHSKTFTLSGNVTGYSGTGSGLTVDVHRVDTGEYIGSATTGTAGAYSFTWYYPNIYTKLDCREDDTHVGRSNRGYAT